jgi:transcriptional regulator with XRE-family HTH domain
MPKALRSSNADRERLNRELARLPRNVTTAITRCMKQRGMNRTGLAHQMGLSPGRVSQILSGDGNLTLGTLAAVCVALDAQLEVKLVPNSSASPATATPAGPISAPARYAAVAAR